MGVLSRADTIWSFRRMRKEARLKRALPDSGTSAPLIHEPVICATFTLARMPLRARTLASHDEFLQGVAGRLTGSCRG